MSDVAASVEAPQPVEVAGATVDAAASAAEAATAVDEKATTETAEDKNGDSETSEEAAEKPADEVAEKTVEQTKDASDSGAAEGAEAKDSDKSTQMLKTTAKIDDDTAKNRKFDAAVLPESDDPEQIRVQVEFYFGDNNLPTDKHMWEITGGPENKPVKVKKICTFNRMRRFKSYDAVVAALKSSTLLNISGPEGEEEITRKRPYDPNRPRTKIDAATVYVKGFGDEEPSTQFDLEAFFTKFGPVKAVRLRRTEEKLFKGSVFVEFEDESSATKFLELDPKPQWKGHDLKIMSKTAYVTEKTQLIREGKIEPSNSQSRFYEGKVFPGRGRGSGRGDRGGSGTDANDWKKRRDQDQKNGFRNDRNGGYGRGRGRGRGRGGPNRRDDRRDDRRDNRRDDRNGRSNGNNVKPTIKATDGNGNVIPKESEKVAAEGTNGTKRAREDDGGNSEPPAKKVAADAS